MSYKNVNEEDNSKADTPFANESAGGVSLWLNRPMEETELPTTLLCPCCNENRDVLSKTALLVLENIIRQKNADPWKPKYGWSVEKAAKGELRWACQSCTDNGRALTAQPWEQTFCDWEPYFAFYDAAQTCEDCGEVFVFGAEEQRFWYEERKFWVQSWPKQCIPCRRKRREQKKEQRKRMEAAEAAKAAKISGSLREQK